MKKLNSFLQSNRLNAQHDIFGFKRLLNDKTEIDISKIDNDNLEALFELMRICEYWIDVNAVKTLLMKETDVLILDAILQYLVAYNIATLTDISFIKNRSYITWLQDYVESIA